MNKFLDNVGLAYVWSKIKTYVTTGFVAKVDGKGLSTNDYTSVDKAKLDALPSNTDLATSLSGKQDSLIEGANITITDDVIASSTPMATIGVFGGIKAKDRTTETNEVVIDPATGIAYTLAGAGEYVLPTATAVIKGGFKVGSGVTMTGEVLSVDTTIIASKASVDALDTALDSKADLVGGLIPTSQLPSYVDDIIEADTFADLPTTGEAGKVYVTTDDNKTFRWTGTAYVAIGSDLALGETASTAYRGDRGKLGYDHSQITSGNPHGITATTVGLGNVSNTADADKPVSTAVQTALDAKLDSADMVALTNAEIDLILV